MKASLTRYQVKTGAFSLADERELKSILFQPRARRRAGGGFRAEDLQPRVRACIEKRGTLVIVLFGSDTPDTSDEQLVSRFRELLAEVGPEYSDANVEIWRQNKLIGFIEHFPGLALAIRKVALDVSAVSHDLWRQQSDFDGDYVANTDTQNMLEAIRRALLEPAEQSIHIRFVGEPGIGKTRLIYEATNDERLRALVVYAEDAERLIQSGFFNHLLSDASRLNLILVADECPPEVRSMLRLKLRNQSGSVRVLSIHNEEDEGDADRQYLYYEPPRLDDNAVAAIIEQYGVPKDQAVFWAKQCDGSPRVANVVGKNLIETGDILRADGLVRIWDRFIAGLDDPKSAHAKKVRFVLQCLAVFKRVGISGTPREIDEVYTKVVCPLDSSISKREFTEILSDFRRRRILQGQHVLYITPKLLHIRLWREWWDLYGAQMDIATLLPNLTEPLAGWFVDMLVYAKESPATEALALKLLGVGGPLYKNEWLNTRTGGTLFLNLAQVEPRAALRCITDTLGEKSPDQLREFRGGRSEAVHALRILATHEDLFMGAAKVLLALAEAETESYSNNATGTFSALFTLGYGRGATTALPPAERLPLLDEILNSSAPAQRALALTALDEALQTRFTQIALDEFQGLRPLPMRWTPKTYGEVFREYERYWSFLRNKLPGLASDEKVRGAQILLQHTRELFSIESMRQLILDTLNSLVDSNILDAGEVLETVVAIQHYDAKAYPAITRKAIDDLMAELQGTGLSALLKRYVRLALLEDQFDEDGNQTDAVQLRLAQLAADSLAQPEDFTQELSWLVTNEAKNGYAFGSELGARDANLQMWPEIYAAWRSTELRNDFFLGGYLNGVFRTNPERWERLIRSLYADNVSLLPELIWRSGITEPIAELLTHAVEAGRVPPARLQLFAYGGASRNISISTVSRWIEMMLDQQSPDEARAALELFDYRMRPGEEDEEVFPADLALQVLTQPALLRGSQRRNNTMLAHHWAKVGKRLALSSPRTALSLAEWMISHLGAKDSFLAEYRSPTLKLLTDIAKQDPERVWDYVSDVLEKMREAATFHVLQWLRGDSTFGRDKGDGALVLFPRNLVWGWVDEVVDTRASLIAECCPKDLSRKNGMPSFALELLERYGNRTDVRSAFSANYGSGSWSGPASAHYQAKLTALQHLLSTESNSNVRAWLGTEIAELKLQVESARIEEERRGF